MSDALKQVAVLAGGRSTRMGADKALVRVGGMMMLERVVRTAMAVCGNVIVAGRDAAPEGWPPDLRSMRFLADAGMKFSGPVAGLITVLEKTGKGEAVLLLGCDMPLVTERTLRGLAAAHAAAPEGTLATMAVSHDADGTAYAEPTLSVYTPALLPHLREMMRSGRKSFQPLLKESWVCRWEVPAESIGEILNVNDAESLAAAERLLQGRG